MERVIELPLTEETAASLHMGDQVLLTGEIYSARDAAHERMTEQLAQGIPLPFDPKDAVVYYMGPSPAGPGRVIGSAGPTTSGRMDRWAPQMISLGVRGMIGKGKRSREVTEAIRRYHGVYFGAIGGAGALLSGHILSSEVVAYEDLGPEAIRKLKVKDFPVIVLTDWEGHDLYERKEDESGLKAGFADLPVREFARRLGSRDAVPGGGGASALVGCVGCALGSMVGHLTVGKKKYANVREEMEELIREADALQEELLALIDRDAQAFEPLSRTYSMPRRTQEEKEKREKAMEAALKDACQVPLQIMEKMCRVIDLVRIAADKGSTLAVSDAGCAAAFSRAALEGASLNVFINTKLMKDRTAAEQYEDMARQMLGKYVPAADGIYESVTQKLMG